MKQLTVFEEDTVPEEDSPNTEDENKDPNKKPKRSFMDLPWGTISGVAGSILLIGVVLGAIWLLLFSPIPTPNTEEAAEIIQEDITATMNTAQAYTVNNERSNTSMLTVETEDGTCKYFRVHSDGLYQAFESEGRVSSGYLNFEPFNYPQSYYTDNAGDNFKVFEYHHSEEEMQHGVHVNMVVGGGFSGDPRSIDISNQYSSHMDVESDSFCF